MNSMSRVSGVLRTFAGKKSYVPILLALSISAVFKLAAFGREAYIASRFGVSAETDVYFALQQLPMSVVTFVLGAFGLAFTPAYTAARRTDEGEKWTAGILASCIALGALLTLVTIGGGPLLLGAIHAKATPVAYATIVLLALSYTPVLISGVLVCVSNAGGRPLTSLIAVGAPYLLMTVTLVGFCIFPSSQRTSLPASWLAGFTLTGLAGLIFIVKLEPFRLNYQNIVGLFRLRTFRLFLRQLGSSVMENIGFVSNQLLLVFFFGMTGLGNISANNYAMRIGMLGYGLLTIPLAQLTQSRLCNSRSDNERPRLFLEQLIMMAMITGAGAAVLCIFREPVVKLIYLRGHFTIGEMHAVVALLPAWFAYFVVISLNAVSSRMLFVRSEGMRYAQTMLCGYAIANGLRLVTAGHAAPVFIIWAAVIGEGLAFLWNLKNCLGRAAAKTGAASEASAVAA